MTGFDAALAQAASLMMERDPKLVEIVVLSLKVSLLSVIFASAIGLPAGALVAVARFPGRSTSIVILNALMGLPSVVVGLVVYLLLSRAGPVKYAGICRKGSLASVPADHSGSTRADQYARLCR